MTTRARAFYLLKIGKLDNGHPTFIRIFKIRFHSSILNTIRRFYKSNVGKSWNDGFPSIYGSQMSSLQQSRSKAHELIETIWLLAEKKSPRICLWSKVRMNFEETNSFSNRFQIKREKQISKSHLQKPGWHPTHVIYDWDICRIGWRFTLILIE